MKQTSFTKSLTVAFSESVFQQIMELPDHQKISRAACERALTELNISK